MFWGISIAAEREVKRRHISALVVRAIWRKAKAYRKRNPYSAVRVSGVPCLSALFCFSSATRIWCPYESPLLVAHFAWGAGEG